jgi:hypothetical protein
MSHRRWWTQRSRQEGGEMAPSIRFWTHPKLPDYGPNWRWTEDNKAAQPVVSLSSDERYETEANNLKTQTWMKTLAVGPNLLGGRVPNSREAHISNA